MDGLPMSDIAMDSRRRMPPLYAPARRCATSPSITSSSRAETSAAMDRSGTPFNRANSAKCS